MDINAPPKSVVPQPGKSKPPPAPPISNALIAMSVNPAPEKSVKQITHPENSVKQTAQAENTVSKRYSLSYCSMLDELKSKLNSINSKRVTTSSHSVSSCSSITVNSETRSKHVLKSASDIVDLLKQDKKTKNTDTIVNGTKLLTNTKPKSMNNLASKSDLGNAKLLIHECQ